MAYEFTARDVETAADFIWKDFVSSHTPAAHPEAFFLGGQPGAGKSIISVRLKNAHPNTFFVNPDTYRNYHPQYNAIRRAFGTAAVAETGKFSGAVTERLLDMLLEQHYNIMVEGTFRTLEVPLRLAQALAAKDYASEIHVIAVSSDASYIGTLDRYFIGCMEDIGRAVNKEHHDLVVKVLSKNLTGLAESGLFSSYHVHTRESEVLAADTAADFLQQFDRERTRPLTQNETAQLKERINFVKNSLARAEERGLTELAETPVSVIRQAIAEIEDRHNLSF